jgi:hypothetical protein
MFHRQQFVVRRKQMKSHGYPSHICIRKNKLIDNKNNRNGFTNLKNFWNLRN